MKHAKKMQVSVNSKYFSCFMDYADAGSVASYSHYRSSLFVQRFQALSYVNKNLPHRRTSSIETNHSRSHSLDVAEGNDSSLHLEVGPTISRSSSYKSVLRDNHDWSNLSTNTEECQVNSVYPMSSRLSSILVYVKLLMFTS